ncbi:MAG TPA: MBL fold metallo-hydrolase [Candidatus Latescibacteria bacterium]|nr:MBL fold metallo-hydrolase [Candidatus Latescibacterota bacterium]
MLIRFWGTRGSLPSPLTWKDLEAKLLLLLLRAGGRRFSTYEDVRAFLEGLPFYERGTFGGNTPCVEVLFGEEGLILDAGTGICPLGRSLMDGPAGKGQATLHILLSHTHWDHIMGFPFFEPAYVPGNRMVIYGGHEGLEARLKYQQDPAHFPISLEDMSADFSFVRLEVGHTYRIAGFSVEVMKQFHPGASYGYRIQRKGKVLVYSTDSEYERTDPDYLTKYIHFFRKADVLIFDAQYSPSETVEKKNWGHSSALVGVDLALYAQVKKLVLFHHAPEADDERIQSHMDEVLSYVKRKGGEGLEVMAAYDGMMLEI